MAKNFLKFKYISNNPKIAVNYCGKGDLIIFLHGIGGNKTNWNRNLIEISKKYLCVAWDMRGYGDSDDYDGPLNFLDVVNDLKILINTFNKSKAHIVGLSMGGQIACLFYEKFPTFVKSLTLCDTHLGLSNLNKKEVEKFVRSRKYPLINGKEPKDIAKNVALSLIGEQKNTVALDELVASISSLHKQSYLKTIDASFSTQHKHIFQTIDIPTLILVGELDKLTPPRIAKEINNLIKKSELIVISRAGHLINIEKPEQFNNLIIKFLDNLTFL